MGRREICNCPWRLHQGQRETERERDMEEGKEGEKEGRRKDTQTQRKCSGFSPLCLKPFLASLLADWSRNQSTREPEKNRPL